MLASEIYPTSLHSLVHADLSFIDERLDYLLTKKFDAIARLTEIFDKRYPAIWFVIDIKRHIVMAAPFPHTAPSSVKNLIHTSSKRFDVKQRSLDDRSCPSIKTDLMVNIGKFCWKNLRDGVEKQIVIERIGPISVCAQLPRKIQQKCYVTMKITSPCTFYRRQSCKYTRVSPTLHVRLIWFNQKLDCLPNHRNLTFYQSAAKKL